MDIISATTLQLHFVKFEKLVVPNLKVLFDLHNKKPVKLLGDWKCVLMDIGGVCVVLEQLILLQI
jgi:hypothetical protein